MKYPKSDSNGSEISPSLNEKTVSTKFLSKLPLCFFLFKVSLPPLRLEAISSL